MKISPKKDQGVINKQSDCPLLVKQPFVTDLLRGHVPPRLLTSADLGESPNPVGLFNEAGARFLRRSWLHTQFSDEPGTRAQRTLQ